MYSKGKVKNLTIIGIFLIIIMSSLAFSQQGGQIISLQRVDFISNDATINGEAWLLTIVQNGASQFARGFFSSNQITDDDKVAKNSIDITIANSPQVCEYDIFRQDQFLSNMDSFIIQKTFFWQINDAIQECDNQGGILSATPDSTIFQFINFDTHCFKPTNTASRGTVSFDKLSFESEIISTINGERFSGTISNANQNSVTLSQGRVHASWVGNLVSGADCPRASAQDIITLRFNNQWRLTDIEDWNTFTNYKDVGFSNCISNSFLLGGVSSKNFDDCVAEYNNFASAALVSKEFSETGGSQARVTAHTDSGKAEIELAKDIQFPVFTMRIKADILGVVVPVGEPEILATDSSCFGTGDEGFLVVDVKNAGAVRATFVTSADCESPFKQSGTSIRTQIDSQRSASIQIPITAETANEEQRANCEITVHDLENPNNQDVVTQQACVKGINLCTGNEERCVGERLEKCNLAGTSWVTISEKSDTCITDECKIDTDCPERIGFTAECKSESLFTTKKACVYSGVESCEPFYAPELPFAEAVTIIPNLSTDCLGITNPIRIALGIIGAIIVFSFAFTRLPFKKKSEKGLKIILSLVLALMAGVIIWFLWWIILIIIALIIILVLVLRFK